jgi:hypothetical protein
VAVQLGLPVKPVTVKVAGAPSEALALAGLTLPEVQFRETLTLAPLLGMKSSCTTNWTGPIWEKLAVQDLSALIVTEASEQSASPVQEPKR